MINDMKVLIVNQQGNHFHLGGLDKQYMYLHHTFVEENNVKLLYSSIYFCLLLQKAL